MLSAMYIILDIFVLYKHLFLHLNNYVNNIIVEHSSVNKCLYIHVYITLNFVILFFVLLL